METRFVCEKTDSFRKERKQIFLDNGFFFCLRSSFSISMNNHVRIIQKIAAYSFGVDLL